MPKIIPALLTNDRNDLKNKLTDIEGLVEWAQIDIMDNKFVPNLSIPVSELINIKTGLNLEAHLMILEPQEVFADCEKAEIKRVIFHVEAVKDIDDVLKQINEFNFEKGIAINPETSIERIIPHLDKIDLVLFLSVNPGFQGRGFIEKVLDKIKDFKKRKTDVKIELDGGVNINNVKKIAEAGVDYIVAGSSVLKDGEYKKNLRNLKDAINN